MQGAISLGKRKNSPERGLGAQDIVSIRLPVPDLSQDIAECLRKKFFIAPPPGSSVLSLSSIRWRILRDCPVSSYILNNIHRKAGFFV